MKIRKQKLKLVVEDILCDVCNRSTKNNDQFVQGSIFATFDSKNYDIDICQSCFNKTLAMLRSFRRKNNVVTKTNPFEGTNE